MKKRLLRILEARTLGKGLLLGLVVLLGANHAFAEGGVYKVTADSKIGSLTEITSVEGIKLTFGEADDWNAPASGSVTVNGETFSHYVQTKGSNGTGDFTGSAYKFEPTVAGELIIVVHNAGSNKTAYLTEDGTDISAHLTELNELSWQSPAVLNAAAAYTGGIRCQVKAGSTYLYYIAGSKGRFNGFIFTPGKSTEYNNLMTNNITPVQNAWNAATQAIAKYAVGDLKPVFDGITKNLNEYSKQLDAAKDTLEVAEAAGKTADRTEEIIAMLPNAGDISALVAKAEALATAYESLNFGDYDDDIEDLNDTIGTLATLDTKAWAADSTEYVITDSLTTIKNMAADACASLDLDSRTDEFEGLLATIASMIDNVELRATEEDSLCRAITPVRTTLENLQQVVKDLQAKDHAQDVLKTYATELEALATQLDELKNKATRDIVRIEGYTTTIAEWTEELKDLQASIENYNDKLNDAAYQAQLAYLAEAQEKKDDYYYRISAKYENDSEKLNANQIEFAKIQTRIDAEKTDSIEAKHDTVKSVEYNSTAYGNIDKIIEDMEDLWKSALSELEQEMIDANNALYNEWTTEWNDSLHAVYTEAIQKIESYKSIEGVSESQYVLSQIEAAEVNLFPIIDDIDALHTEVTEAKDSCNINPTDGTVSRLVIDEYTARAEDIFTDIDNSVHSAREAANDVANDYLSGIIRNYSNQLRNAVQNSSEQECIDALRAATVTAATTRLNKAYTDKTVADSIDVIKAMFDGFDEKLAAIKAEDAAHSKVNKAVNDLQAYWTQAWGGRDENSEAALNKLHDDITALEESRDKNIGNLVEKQDELIATADSLYNEIYKWAEPEAYAANEAAYTEAKEALSALNELIETTRTTLNGYSDEVKNAYLPDLESCANGTPYIESKIEASHDARTMAEDLENVKSLINAYTSQINGIAAAAAKAEEGLKAPSADVNNDGVIDAVDIEAVKAGVQGTEYDATLDLNRDGKVDVLDLTIVIKACLSESVE